MAVAQITSPTTSRTTAYTLTGVVEGGALVEVWYRVNGGPQVDLPLVSGPFSVGLSLREGRSTFYLYVDSFRDPLEVDWSYVDVAPERTGLLTREDVLDLFWNSIRVAS